MSQGMQERTPYIMPEQSFRILLLQETIRANRMVDQSNVMTMKTEHPFSEDPGLYAVAHHVHGVLRGSDVMGILDEKTIGIILHDSEAQSADRIVERLNNQVKGLSHKVHFMIYNRGKGDPSLSSLVGEEETLGFTDMIMTYIMPESVFRHLIEVECRRARRKGGSFSLIVINQQEPDSERSRLYALATFLRRLIRVTDVIGNLQETKFGIILPRAEAQGLRLIWNRVRDGIYNHPSLSPQIQDRHDLRIGGACFPNDASTPDELLRVAVL